MKSSLSRAERTTPPHASPTRSLSRALIGGAIAGLAGAWVISRFAALREADDRAAVPIAQAIARRFLRRLLTPDQLVVIVPSLRYALGAVSGAGFTVLRPSRSPIVVGGAAFGLLLWVMSDVALLAAAREVHVRPHSCMAVSVLYHLVFGVTTDVVQRNVDAVAVMIGATA